MRNFLFITWFLFAITAIQAQENLTFSSPLKMEEIMQGENWIGVSPTYPKWSLDNKYLYFQWQKEEDEHLTWYVIETGQKEPRKASLEEQKNIQFSNPSYSSDQRWAVYELQGDLYLWDVRKKQSRQLTDTPERESSPKFIKNDSEIAFRRGENLYSLSLKESKISQISYTTREQETKKPSLDEQKKWLKNQQEIFDVLREEASKTDKNKKQREALQVTRPTPLRLSKEENIGDIAIDQEAEHLFYTVYKRATDPNYTEVPNYVTESGYTEELRSRPKVGSEMGSSSLYYHNLVTDSLLKFDTSILPGIQDLPEYLEDYPNRKKERQENIKNREVSFGSVHWNPRGTKALFSVYSTDNKDRWIVVYDTQSASYITVNRQRDEAWIAGPGISRYNPTIGWIDNEVVYYQSEKTGYSHLYTHHIKNSVTTALTEGKYEVQSVELSKNKKYFYLTTNQEHPGITHYYKLDISTKKLTTLTHKKGGNRVWLSPDESWMAILHSSSTTPWELFIKKTSSTSSPTQITSSTTEAFNQYDWRAPEMVTFTNRLGRTVHARVYAPEQQHASRPAVVFVHGAGYLQNVHYWWSQYFREYMFHNMLADLGYTVIDIDYTASSGYGRDHRTGIYRHMGGADLTDQVDGVKYLIEHYNINPDKVGIYGGSYGGFITLMALFTEQETFKSGAALRSVTDWAHYNHGYTSNILNQPYEDPIAYEKSSPIYFADGLEGHLLMCHGIIDVNVQFQDIVRLSQRLIELEKENWELAVYPLEDHGFVHTTSWIDEYKRILKLFETTLK